MILVTGATGTIGPNVIKLCAARGWAVRAGVHNLVKGQALAAPDVSVVELDLDSRPSVAAAMEGVDRVVLITPLLLHQVEHARLVIDEARRAGVRTIVHISSANAGSEHAIQLDRWHREAEKHLEESSVGWTILRPSSYMQNFVRFFGGPIKTDDEIRLPLGDGRVAWIDAADVAAVTVECLLGSENEGKHILLTGNEPLGAAQCAEHIGNALGRDVAYVDVPEETARGALAGSGLPDWQVKALLELHASCKAGEASEVSGEVQRVLGRPPASFADFARQDAAAWR